MKLHTLKMRRVANSIVLISLLFALPALPTTSLGRATVAAKEPDTDGPYHIALKSRQFVPAPGFEAALTQELARATSKRRHVLLQFTEVPTAEQRASLAKAGIRLLDYVPNLVWFASIPTDLRSRDLDTDLVRWIGRIEAADRLAPTLRAPQAGALEGPVELDIHFFSDVSAEAAIPALQAHRAEIVGQDTDWNRYAARLDASEINSLAQEDGILWIAPAPPPKVPDNDGIRARTRVDAVHNAPYGLTGSGVDLGIWDGGAVDSHTDFSGRLTIAEAFLEVSNHATHVAGTMAGDGRNSANRGGSAFQWKGMAPGADIISYDFYTSVGEHDEAINTYGIELSQNSWGRLIGDLYGNCWLYGDYDLLASDYDALVTGRYGTRISVVFSAGNERADRDCGMSSTPPYINYANIGPPHTAKNAIVVGATNSDDDSMTDFSSWGPVDDGRLKPDVVAPGCQPRRLDSDPNRTIWSTLPGDTYGGSCGTSMAAPVVSGVSALLIEQYRTTEGRDPLPSTIKALLIHTAVDMDDGNTVYYNPGPDYASGYGRVNAQAAADAIRARQVREDQASNGQTDVYTLTVPADAPALKVTLAWDDVPGTRNAIPALVNNLDLVLVEPDGTTTHRPWVLDPANPSSHATRGIDNINNVEQVQVSNPAAGTWQVRVSGTQVPQGPQLYSLVSSASTDDGGEDVGPLVYDGHAIDDASGNGDGVPNPGETIALTITLRNNGSDPANDVQATLDTDDPYVSVILTDTATFGDIAGGGTASHAAPLGFQIKPTAPDEQVIQFGLTISASNGGPWSDALNVTVYSDEQTARVSIDKAVEPTAISAGDLLTYTVRRTLTLSGTHTYTETLIDPIPQGTNYVADSVTLDGVPAPEIYSPTLGGLYLQQSGTFTDSHALNLTFHVQVGSGASTVVNTVTGTASVDGAPLPAPYTASVSATACDLPAAPGLFAPVNGAVTCDAVPNFAWNWVIGVEGYRIQVADDPDFRSPLVDQTLASEFLTFFTVPDPLAADTYYWRVLSYDTCGESAWSEAWSLTVLSTPAAPVLSAPADGIKTGDRTPTFAWEDVTGADTYLVQVDDDSGFGSPIVDETVTATTYTPSADLETGVYYWRVRASSPCGTSEWSTSWTVTITPAESILLYLPLVLSNSP